MNIKYEDLAHGWRRVSYTVTVPKESLWERVKALFIPKERAYTFSQYLKPVGHTFVSVPTDEEIRAEAKARCSNVFDPYWSGVEDGFVDGSEWTRERMMK